MERDTSGLEKLPKLIGGTIIWWVGALIFAGIMALCSMPMIYLLAWLFGR